MHKLLIILFLFVFFFFLKSDVSAACRSGYSLKCVGYVDPDVSDNMCPGPGTTRIAPTCIADPPTAVAPGAGAAAALPPAAAPAPCAGNNCTKGSGQHCFTHNGEIVQLKPGQAIAVNPATGKAYGTGIYTAIGCVPTEPKEFVEGLLKYGALAAGGIAFLIMILGALQMITAEGNPEAIKGAQEKFYSAIIGLLIIIFSVLLMQVIGVDILGLPGFGR